MNVSLAPIVKYESSYNDKKISDSKLKWHESLWGKIENFTYGYSSKNDKRTDKILGGLGFVNVLEEVTEEASADMERVSDILVKLNDDLKSCAQNLTNFPVKEKKSRKEFEKINETIGKIGEEFKDIIDNSISQNIEILDKKNETSITLPSRLWEEPRRERVHCIKWSRSRMMMILA